jgi:predicted MPP superfamily phosphohydrolase
MLIYESFVIAVIAYTVLYGLDRWYASRRALLIIATTTTLVYVIWVLVHFAHAPLRALVVPLAGTWSSCVLLSLAIGLPWLVARGVFRTLRRPERVPVPKPKRDPLSRRGFLTSIALPVAGAGLGIVASGYGGNKLLVAHRTFHIRNWPKALDGMRIGQITDTHVGDFISADWVAHAVHILNQANVDLQVMTGDLIDDLHYLDASFDALDSCRANLGMLCVLGNHEKMHRRLQPVLGAYRERHAHGRVRLLVDESAVLEYNGHALSVVGVDYPMHTNGSHILPKEEQLRLMRRSAERAFQFASPPPALLCLSHHPDFFPLAQERGAHLTLSGHTHGGQLAVFGTPLFAPYEFNLGHYRRADSHLYVSGGTGHWLPLRIGVPMEVTIITVRSA